MLMVVPALFLHCIACNNNKRLETKIHKPNTARITDIEFQRAPNQKHHERKERENVAGEVIARAIVH